MVRVMASIAFESEHAGPDARHEFHTVEQWKSQADVDAHMRTPHIATAMAEGEPMSAQPPAIHVVDKIG